MSNEARGKTHPYTVVTARFLRHNPTNAEARLWDALRNRQVCGLKFRRQHPFGSFILDFFCPRLQLAIEVDGAVHESPDQRSYDAAREEFLRDRGIRVLRFTNDEVENRLTFVLEAIEAAAAQFLNVPSARSDPPSVHVGEGLEEG